jgi:endonuclease/exonuclease/phosphatase family metal-dependent hydrolase
MKNTYLFLLLLFTTCSYAQNDLQVMTLNIRFATEADGQNQWNNRKEKVTQTLLYHDVVLCGMQEALYTQIEYVANAMPTHGWIGVGREDGKQGGEFSPIFYDKNRLKLLESNTFWLSETPEKPTKGWDASFKRVVTWGLFLDRKTKKKFYCFNTHFDHQGVVARRESAKLLLQKVQQIAQKTPFVVMGDFNAFPSDEPILLLTDTSKDFYFQDSKSLSKTPHFGPEGTFNGFGNKERDNAPIDYIFCSKAFVVKKHATLSTSWGGFFASDHFAVLATLKW